MSGIFPASWDGGIPPNAETPDNPPQAFVPDHYVMPPDTTPLYYGLGCDTRIRAPVLNSIISEIIATCDHANVIYRAASLQNLLIAILNLGGWSGIAIRQAPARYAVTFNPKPPRYVNFMRLILVADQTNTAGQVRINVNDLGELPLLSTIGAELSAGAIQQNIPFVCVYFDETQVGSAYNPTEVAGRFYKVSA